MDDIRGCAALGADLCAGRVPRVRVHSDQSTVLHCGEASALGFAQGTKSGNDLSVVLHVIPARVTEFARSRNLLRWMGMHIISLDGPLKRLVPSRWGPHVAKPGATRGSASPQEPPNGKVWDPHVDSSVGSREVRGMATL